MHTASSEMFQKNGVNVSEIPMQGIHFYTCVTVKCSWSDVNITQRFYVAPDQANQDFSGILTIFQK